MHSPQKFHMCKKLYPGIGFALSFTFFGNQIVETLQNDKWRLHQHLCSIFPHLSQNKIWLHCMIQLWARDGSPNNILCPLCQPLSGKAISDIPYCGINFICSYNYRARGSADIQVMTWLLALTQMQGDNLKSGDDVGKRESLFLLCAYSFQGPVSRRLLSGKPTPAFCTKVHWKKDLEKKEENMIMCVLLYTAHIRRQKSRLRGQAPDEKTEKQGKHLNWV